MEQSITKLSNMMSSWAEMAQQEYIDTQMAIADTLSNKVEEGGFSLFDPTSWNEDYAQSEKSRFIANIGRDYVVQTVSGIVARLNMAQSKEDQVAAMNKFYNFVESLKEAAPQSYLAWQNIEQTELKEEVKDFGSQKKRKWTAKDYGLKVGLPIVGVGGLAFAYMQYQKSKDIPTRENFLPAIPAIAMTAKVGSVAISGFWAWAGLAAATTAVGVGLGAGTAWAIQKFGGENQYRAQFDGLPSAVSRLKKKVEDGQTYKGPQNKTSFYTALGFPNAMRTCALEADQAKDQTIFALYACTYATGDAQYADMADGFEGSWYSFSTPFKDFQSAQVEMQKALNLMYQSNNPLVQMIATDFAVIATATCMNASVESAKLMEQGGGDACPDEDVMETILKTIEGLFMFGEKPCRFTEKDWRRIKMATYIPMGLITIPYVMPVVKPIFSMIGSGLSKKAKKMEREVDSMNNPRFPLNVQRHRRVRSRIHR